MSTLEVSSDATWSSSASWSRLTTLRSAANAGGAGEPPIPARCGYIHLHPALQELAERAGLCTHPPSRPARLPPVASGEQRLFAEEAVGRDTPSPQERGDHGHRI